MQTHGPLYFDPFPTPWPQSERAIEKRILRQAWDERRRMVDAMGWFEDPPPMPAALQDWPEPILQRPTMAMAAA